MDIGIFETEHFETAYTLIRLFDVPGNSISVYTNEPTFKQLKASFGAELDHYTWILQYEQESNYRFIKRIGTILSVNPPAVFFYSTISNNHLYHALLLKRLPLLRSVLTIHNLNSMLHPKIRPGLKSLVRFVGKKMLLTYAKELNVISETMTDFLKRQLKSPKIIHTLPGSIYENNGRHQEIIDRIRLVIPGSIDNQRRNYLQALDLMNILEKKQLMVDMVFAGQPVGTYGSAILRLTRKWQGKYTTVTAYESLLPQKEFDSRLQEVHFVYIPSVAKSQTKDAVEIYGVTKFSGSIYDAVRYAKPYIIPHAFHVPEKIKESGFRYEQVSEISDFLEQLLTSPGSYSAWKECAIASSNCYTTDAVRNRNPSFFNK